MFIKITSNLQQALGATTAEAAGDKLAEILTGLKASGDAAETADAIEAVKAEHATEVAALKASVMALEGKLAAIPTPITEARITELANSAGSRAAATALAGTGSGVPTPPAPTQGPIAGATDELVAAGKFKEAWAQNADLKSEFPSAECYDAFKRNESKITIATRKPVTA